MTKDKRSIFFQVLGGLFLVFAVIGIFLPIVPQIPFAIVSAYFFSKGNPRIHRWILNQKHFGAAVRDWEMDRVIRPSLKRFSVALMLGGAGLAIWLYREESPVVAVALPFLFGVGIVFVLSQRSRSRPTREPPFVARIGRFSAD
ncbi:MAG: YbaN family protein [Bdellovibrionales bacterium]|nr:YbaN family protein [Bdellovibrionales bacterium]